jgi:hypothetical protein
MADAYIKLILDDDRLKTLDEIGLADKVEDIEGQKVLRVEMTRKDRKKLAKGFEGLAFDATDTCVLPEDGDGTLWQIITEMKTVDVMKFAITKLYNPLAGRSISGRGSTGGR